MLEITDNASHIGEIFLTKNQMQSMFDYLSKVVDVML